MSFSAGRTLAHYEILDLLGRGGMGEVYRARDVRLDREVAIKVLPAGVSADGERLSRFEREAKTLASLNHPNVATIYGVDREDDTFFLALELVPGEDLADRLERGPLPVDEALAVAAQVARGLEAAHAAGVVHRDLKPGNVRVTPDGRVKLLDFGLAKAVERADPSKPDSVLMTREGLVLGTPVYMSPEQARGRTVDQRTDVWAFGCVLYECLTGARAFGGSTVTELVAAIVQDEPDWSALPKGTPAHVVGLLRGALEKDPAERTRDGAALRLALDGARPGAVRSGGASRWRTAIGIAFVAVTLFASLPYLSRAFGVGEPVEPVEPRVPTRPEVVRGGIAVLPFVNMSGDPENQYFSDGVSEEILNLLARLGTMRVASRTSSFALRDSGLDVPAIAERLGVGHVVEGSVRRAGGQVRVTVQLIDAVADSHLWSETFDRGLEDIFAVQDEIASAIVSALETTLRPGDLAAGAAADAEGEAEHRAAELARIRAEEEARRLAAEEAAASEVDEGVSYSRPEGSGFEGIVPRVRARPTSFAAYELYLRARHLWHRRGEANLRRAIELFEEAVEIDSEYARAWSGMALAWSNLPAYSDLPYEDALVELERCANRALEIDPDNLEAKLVLPDRSILECRWADALAAFEELREVASGNATYLLWHAELLITLGHLERARSRCEDALAVDVAYPPLLAKYALVLDMLGESELAQEYAQAAADVEFRTGHCMLAQLALERDDVDAAREHYRLGLEPLGITADEADLLIDAVEDESLRGRAIALLDRLADDIEHGRLGIFYIQDLLDAYARLGHLDGYFALATAMSRQGFSTTERSMWTRQNVAVRRDPRFAAFVRERGLLDYWRAVEWPDLCREGGSGLVCD